MISTVMGVPLFHERLYTIILQAVRDSDGSLYSFTVIRGRIGDEVF